MRHEMRRETRSEAKALAARARSLTQRNLRSTVAVRPNGSTEFFCFNLDVSLTNISQRCVECHRRLVVVACLPLPASRRLRAQDINLVATMQKKQPIKQASYLSGQLDAAACAAAAVADNVGTKPKR